MTEGIGYWQWLGIELVTLPGRLKTAWISSKWMRKKFLNNIKYIIGHPATEITIGMIGTMVSTVSILITTFFLASRSCFMGGFYMIRTWSFIGIVLSFFPTTHGVYRSRGDC